MKIYSFFLCAVVLFLSSCKPAASPIITSKEAAIAKGTYKPKNVSAKPVENSINSKKVTTVSQKESKKRVISENHDNDFIADDTDVPYLALQILNTADDYNGVSYRGGGTTRAGMDCSGLVFTCFKTYDIILPRSSNDMAKVGKKITKEEVRKGDLIFFKTNGRSVINHVGIVSKVLPDEIIFIHSSTQRGVIYSSTKEPYYQRTFAQINRVIE